MEEHRVLDVIKRILEHFPRRYEERDPFRVLISTVLSQRTRDENTDKASKLLFEVFPDVYSLSRAEAHELHDLIRSSGMYRQKAERIVQIARILVQKYGGRVPDNLEELVKLPGVGRKTANIVLAVSYHKPALAVDTHVHRISNRIGLVKTKSPLQTEKQLTKIVPENLWAQINGPMVEFGRTVCLPRKPRCKICPLAGECGYYKNLSTQK